MAGNHEVVQPTPSEGVPQVLKERAGALGLRTFTQEEVEAGYVELARATSIGVTRGTSEEKDRGLPALASDLRYLDQNRWEAARKAKKDRSAICLAAGGTNIGVYHAFIGDGNKVVLNELAAPSYPHGKQSFTHPELLDFFAEEIYKAMREHGLDVDTLGVSLGFPFEKHDSDFGPDGAFTSSRPAKRLELTDMHIPPGERLFGEGLVHRLEKLGHRFAHMTVANDTIAVAQDVNVRERGKLVAPLSLVGGTGTNVAVRYGDRQIDEQMFNLEIAKYPVADPDPVMQRVMKYLEDEGIVGPGARPIIEYYTGMFIPYRVSAALELLGQEDKDSKEAKTEGKEDAIDPEELLALSQIVRKLDTQQIGAIATGNLNSEDILRRYHEKIAGNKDTLSEAKAKASLTEKTIPLLEYLSDQAMRQASQLYAMMLCSATFIVDENPFKDIVRLVPTEGSVVLHGKVANGSVKGLIEDICRELGVNVELVAASGPAGIAALAITHAHEREGGPDIIEEDIFPDYLQNDF